MFFEALATLCAGLFAGAAIYFSRWNLVSGSARPHCTLRTRRNVDSWGRQLDGERPMRMSGALVPTTRRTSMQLILSDDETAIYGISWQITCRP